MRGRSDVITVGGVRLECRRIGELTDNVPVLVFLHEGLGSVAMWGSFPERLCTASRLPGFVYSRQGYGRSDPFPLPRTIRYLHDEALNVLPELLDAVAINRAILVGHSDGASIALIHAAADEGGRVLALALLAAHVFNEKKCVKAIGAAREAYLSGNLRRRLARYHDDVDNAFWGWNDIWLEEAFRAWSIIGNLSCIRVPLLHIQGVQDAYGGVAQPETIAAYAGGPVETTMLSDCGHAPHRDQPDLVLRYLRDFLWRLPVFRAARPEGLAGHEGNLWRPKCV